MQRRAFLGIAALLAGAPAATQAHHGWSGYEAGQAIALTGKILEVGYDYPHVAIRLQAADKVWVCVLAPPYRMDNRGLPRDALKPGDTATVEGYPHRTDRAEMRAERITVGGKTVELR